MEKEADIIDIAKRRGFFWQSSHIYRSVAGFYDYGHIGTLVKRKFENIWRSYFLGLDDNFYEIQSSLLMPEEVFKASGHLESFVDPIVKCGKCGNVERADHILESELKETFEGLSPADLMGLIKKHGIKCSKCKGNLESAGELNMMFPVNVGTGKEIRKVYLTPETAQGAYVNFRQMFEVLRKKLPLGLAVIGKAFRNEISPRQTLIRMREFTQAELQMFFDPDKINEHPDFKSVESYKIRIFSVKNRAKNKIEEISCNDVLKLGLPKFYVYYMAKIQKFYLDVLKIPRESFRFKELSEEERAFYNKCHWDVEIDLKSVGGWKEIAGLHYRTDHDLKNHQKISGQSMEVNIEGRKFIPHVLEISMGVDRNLYALFELALVEEKERVVLRFPGIVSPYDAGIFPLVNKDGLQERAKEIQKSLKENGFLAFYDESGSIGRRYRRMDEIGVLISITCDYQTLEDNTVTLRDRDSMKQIRVKVSGLAETLRIFLEGEKLEKLGKFIN